MLICFLLSILAFSQTNTLTFQPVNNPLLQSYNIRHINTGSDGKLWLSTDNGLLCYDGNDVKIYQHKDNIPFTLSTNNILKTYTDSKGNLFVLESPQIIDYINIKTGKVTPLDISLKNEDFKMMGDKTDFLELFIDEESIWIANHIIGFVRHNMITKKTDTYYFAGEYSGKNTVYTIKKNITAKNILWLGTENGIYSFDKTTNEIKRNFRCSKPSDSSDADLQVTNIDLNSNDTIWFTVPGKGLGCYEIKSGFYTMYPFINKNIAQKSAGIDILKMQKKDKENYFIATENNLPGIFNTVTHVYDFKIFNSQNLPAVLLNHFLIDSSGNFWCVLYNRLYMAHNNNNKFSTIALYNYAVENNRENFFKNIVWDSRRKRYYAAFEKSNEVFVLDSNLNLLKSILIAKEQNEVAQSSIYDLGIDKQNRLWVCGTDLYVYDEITQKLVVSNKKYPKLLFHKQWFQNLVFRDDYMYLQPSNQTCRAIYRINLQRMNYDSIPLPKEMVNDTIKYYQPGRRLDFLVMDKKGENTYWGYNRNSFSGYIDGIIKYDLKTRKARRISHAPQMNPPNSNHIFPYVLDDSDRLWIGGDNNFAMYEPENDNLIKRININETTAAPGGLMCNAEGKNIICELFSDCVLLYDYKNNKKYKLTLNDGLISYSNSGIAYANNLLFTGAGNYIQYIPLSSAVNKPDAGRKCYLSSLQLFNKNYLTDTLPQYLHTVNLPHDKNFVSLTFSSTEFKQPEGLEYRYRLDGIDKSWVYVGASNRTISYNDLAPGNYTFHAEVKNNNGSWSDDGVSLSMDIIPAWWQTVLFKILAIVALGATIYLFVRWRIKSIKQQEQLKSKYQKELLELEAKALRAQMNPHFIFNCMNSIKSLIQKNEHEKAVNYLTTFSKLIRTIFQNSDKREISLYDEVETCRLYTELESMRFKNKFSYIFNIDEALDLKSIKVPALIIQPFIENAIWHGIMPKENGGSVTVTVDRIDHTIRCIIDDNGIGREISKQNKFLIESSSHESKGERLTQARLDLDNLLNERNASVEINDKKDENDKPDGTYIILSFDEY